MYRLHAFLLVCFSLSMMTISQSAVAGEFTRQRKSTAAENQAQPSKGEATRELDIVRRTGAKNERRKAKRAEFCAANAADPNGRKSIQYQTQCK